MKLYYRLVLLCSILTLLITGCSKSEPIESATIKVMYHNNYSFNTDYANLFRAKYPNIELELVDLTGVSRVSQEGQIPFEKLIETEQPDVLLLSAAQYKKYYLEGKLLDLESLIKQSKYSLESIHPGVLETVKFLGGGKLYGLAPTFNSSAMFYNKDLFDKYQIDYPTDQMTWEEVLALAQRFPSEDKNGEKIFGLDIGSYESTPSGLLTLVNGTHGLNEVDQSNIKLMANTAEQKKNVEMIMVPFKTGVIRYNSWDGIESTLSFEEQNPFIYGKSAMHLDQLYFFHNTVKENKIRNLEMNWDIVTVTEPVDPRYPENSTSFYLQDIFAISAKSSNQKAAWEFIKYINSEEVAKLKSKSSNSLLSRTGLMKEMNGHSLESFYKLKFTQSVPDSLIIPTSFLRAYRLLQNQQFKEVMDNKKSIEEAMDTIQTEGQDLLDAIMIKVKQE